IKQAIEVAAKAVKNGYHPFACIVIDPSGKVVWKDHNKVKKTFDPTSHGEINAVRHLCKKLKTLSLKGYVFYTTSEPCPMCFTVMNNAQVSAVYFGASFHPTQFLPISAKKLAKYAKKYPIKVTGGILKDECLRQREKLWKR
ncbi:MAG: nucleoside deaminase, partial [bacterium]|nr:nucleoside deaminase [bacterium]